MAKPTIPQGVKDFQADKKYAKATEIVTLTCHGREGS